MSFSNLINKFLDQSLDNKQAHNFKQLSENFTKIVNNTCIDMSWSYADTCYLEVIGSKSDFANLIIIFLDDTIEISANNIAHNFTDQLQINLSGPTLTNVVLQSSGSVNIKDIDTTEINLRVNGSGKIKASGYCQNLIASLNGSGTINTKKLDSQNLNATINGSGDIKANCSLNLIAKLNGSGDIKIYGNFTNKNITKNGSGDVQIHAAATDKPKHEQTKLSKRSPLI